MRDVNIPMTAPTLAAMAEAADGFQNYNNFNAFGGSALVNDDYAHLVATATAFDWCNQWPFSGNNCSVGGNNANNSANSTVLDNISFMVLTYILSVIFMTYSRVNVELWVPKAIGELGNAKKSNA